MRKGSFLAIFLVLLFVAPANNGNSPLVNPVSTYSPNESDGETPFGYLASDSMSGSGDPLSTYISGILKNSSAAQIDALSSATGSLAVPGGYSGTSLDVGIDSLSMTVTDNLRNGDLNKGHDEAWIDSGYSVFPGDIVVDVPDSWTITKSIGYDNPHPIHGDWEFNDRGTNGYGGSLGWEFQALMSGSEVLDPSDAFYLSQLVHLPWRDLYEVRISFYYYVLATPTVNDQIHLFIKLGDMAEKKFNVFASGEPIATWTKKSATYTISDLASIVTPTSLMFEIGLATDVSGSLGSAYDVRVRVDEIEIETDVRPFPEQIELSVNNTAVIGSIPMNRSVSIPDNDGRDCWDYTSGIDLDGYNNDGRPEFGLWGTAWDTASVYEIGLQFPLDIPQGAIIERAYVEIESSGGSSYVQGKVHMSSEMALGGPIEPFSDHIGEHLEDAYSWIASSYDWQISTWTTGVRYATPDLAPFLQQIVASPDWTSDQYIAVMVSYMWSNYFQYFNNIKGSIGFDGDALTRLYVSYRVPLDDDIIPVENEIARRNLQYQKTITVDHTKVVTDLTDFPLLIDIIDTDLHTDVLPGGEDIAFMVNGQFVEHEIEFFDREYSGSEAHLVAWVKVPFLSSSSDTVITMLYGNSRARSLQTSGVWSDYEIVHHMNEAPNGTLVDSSGNLHYGTSFGGMADSQLVAGAIGNSIEFDGSNDAITVGQIDTDDWSSFTVTGWVSQDVIGDDRIFSKAPDTDPANAIIHFAIDTTPNLRVRMNTDGTGGGSSGSVDSNAVLTPGTWYYLAWTWSAATASMRLYVNGTLDKSAARDGDTVLDSIVPFVIGNWQTGTADNRFFDGKADEIRMTQMVLSDGWIGTEFNNQLSPSTFYSVGSEQANPMTAAYQSTKVIFSTESDIPVNIGYTLDIGYEGVGTSLDENFTEGTSFSITNGSATVDWTAKILISPPLGTQSVEMSVQYPATDWTPVSVYNPLNQQKSNPTDWVSSGGILTIKASAIDIYGVWTLHFEGENHVSDFNLGKSGQSLGITGSFNDEDELVFQGLTPYITGASSQLNLIDPAGAEWHTATNTTVGGTSHEIPTFQYRKDITVDHLLVDADLTHFPMLVDLIDSDLHDTQKVQADGDDILFVQNGVILAHEVQEFDQNYDASNGRLIAWVRTNLSSTVDTAITMYYGNPFVGPQERPTEVWSDDYMAVWHLEETPTGALHEIDDSTTYQNDGTAEGATLGYASSAGAKVGSGLAFDEVDDLIRMNDSASLDSIASSGTFQLWIWWDTAIDGDWQTIMASSNAFSGSPNDGYEWSVQNDGDLYFYPWRGDGSCYNLDTNPFTDKQWHHLAVTMDYSTRQVIVYIDGNAWTPVIVNCLSFWTQIASSDDILWGGHPDTASRYFDGMFDEIRASSVVRTQPWLAAEFANQNNPSAFYSVGSEVERSQVSPSFKKVMTSAPAGLWTAVIRYNDSGSSVDYMVGAYERNFIIRHDVALTLQSPGDAASSGISVRLAGEMLHVEVELTDTDVGSQPVAGATVTMNWTDTGSPVDVTLNDYGTGVYGVALNTSDLATARSWRIEIQSSHQYYNPDSISFDLELYHGTSLKYQWLTTTPVGLDTTVTLVYTDAFDGTPITGATIRFANGTEITPIWQSDGMYNITLGTDSLSMGDYWYILEASHPAAFMIDADVNVTLTMRPHFTAVSASGDFIQPWGDTVDVTILLIDMDTGQPLDIGLVQSFTFSWDATGDTENSPADYIYLLDSSGWAVGVKSVTLSVALSSSNFYLSDDYSFDVTIRSHRTSVSVTGILVEPYGNDTSATVVLTDLDTGGLIAYAYVSSFTFASSYGTDPGPYSSFNVVLDTDTWAVGTTQVTLTVAMSGSLYFNPSSYNFNVEIRILQTYLYNEPSDLRFPNGDDFAIYLHVDVSEPNSQYYGDPIDGLETNFVVTNATFTFPKTITPMGNGRYYLVIDTSYFTEGTYTITVSVDDAFDNHAVASLVITFIYQPAESQLSSPNYPSVITAYQTDVTITLEYRDIDRDVGINGASISSNISISVNPLGSGQYEVTLQVSALAKGTHGFKITAYKLGYTAKTLDFTLTIRIAYTYAIPTVGALNIPVGNDPVFYVDYWDTDHDVSIDGATVLVANWPHTLTITYEPGNQRYRIDFITLDTDTLEQNRVVTFNFSKGENYQFGIFTISVTIRTHNTDFRLVSSVEPTSSTGIFNISVYYGDLDNGVGITNSSNLIIVSVVNKSLSSSIFAIVPDTGQGNGFYIIRVPASQFGLGTQTFNITFTWTGAVAKYFDKFVIATASLVGEDSVMILKLSSGPTAYLGVMNYTFFYSELFSGVGITNTSNPYGDGNVHIYVSFQGVSVDTSQIDITEILAEPGNYTIGFSSTIFDSTGLFYMNVYINWTAGVAPYYTNRLDVISVRVLARDTLLSVNPPTPTSYGESVNFTFTYEDVTGGASTLILDDPKMNVTMNIAQAFWSLYHDAGTFTIELDTTVFGALGPDTFTLSVEWAGAPFYANRTGRVISITINPRQAVIDYQPPAPTQWSDIVTFNVTWSDVTSGTPTGISSATLTLYDGAVLVGSSFYNITEYPGGVYQVEYDTTYYSMPGTYPLRVYLSPDAADWFIEDDQATQNFNVRYRVTILSAEPLTRQPYNSTLTIILYYQDILTLDSIPDPGGLTTLDIVTPGTWIMSYSWNAAFQYYEVTLETYDHPLFEIGSIYTLEFLMTYDNIQPFYLPDNTFVSFQFRARISTLEPSESPLPTAYLDKANFTLLYYDVDGDRGIAGATISVYLGASPLVEGAGNDYLLTDLGAGYYRLSVETTSLGSTGIHTLTVYANWAGSPFYSNRSLGVDINTIRRPTNVELLSPPGLTRYTDNVTFTIAFTDLGTLQYVAISKSNLMLYRGVTLLAKGDFAFSLGALANTYDISIDSTILCSGLSIDSNILIAGLGIDLSITVDWLDVPPYYADDTTTLEPVIRNRLALLSWDPIEPTPLGDLMDLSFTIIDRETEAGISDYIILFDSLQVSPLLEGTHYTLVRGVGVDAGNYTIRIDTNTLLGIASYTFYLRVVWDPSTSPYYANQTQRVITGSTQLIASSLSSGGASPSTVPFYTDVTIDVTFTDEDHNVPITGVLQQNVSIVWSHSGSEPAIWSWTELGSGVYRIIVDTTDAGQSGIRIIEIGIDWYPYTPSVAPPVSFQVRNRIGSTSVDYIPGDIYAGDDTYVIIWVNDTDAGYTPILAVDDLIVDWDRPSSWIALGDGRYNISLTTLGLSFGIETLQVQPVLANYAFQQIGVGITLQAITIKIVIPSLFTSPPRSVTWGEEFTFHILVNDTVHNELVPGLSPYFTWTGGDGYMTGDVPPGNYSYTIPDTSLASVGAVAIIITAGSGNYAFTQAQITLIIDRVPTSLTPNEFTKTLARGTPWDIIVYFETTPPSSLPVAGATAAISAGYGAGLPLMDIGGGWYRIPLDTDATIIGQKYVITITASKQNYEDSSTSVQLEIIATDTATYLDAYTASLVAVPWSTVVRFGVWVVAPDLNETDPYYYQADCSVEWRAEGGLSGFMDANLSAPGHFYYYLDTSTQGLSASTYTFNFYATPGNNSFDTSSVSWSIILQRIPTSVDSPPTTSYIWGWFGWIDFTYWNELDDVGIEYSLTEPTEALYSWGEEAGQATYFGNGTYGVFINTTQLVPQSAPYQLSITFQKANYESKSGIFLLRVQPVSTEITVYSEEVNQIDRSTNLRVPFGDTLQITILYNSTENPIDTPIIGGMSGATWMLPDGDAFLILPYGGKENITLLDLGNGNYTFSFDTNMYQVSDGYSVYIELYLANRTRSSVRIVISVIDVPTDASFPAPPNASYSLVTNESEQPLIGVVSMDYGESITVLIFFFDDWPGHSGEGITSASIVPIVGESYLDLISIEANRSDDTGAGYYMITIHAPVPIIPINLDDREGTLQIILTKDNFATKTITLRVHVAPTEFQGTMTQLVNMGVPLLFFIVLIGVLYSRVFSVPKRLRQINGMIKTIRKGKIPKPVDEALSRQEILADLFNATYAELKITRKPDQMPVESIEIAVPEMGELLIQLAILTNLSADELEEFQADISKMRISEQAAFVKEVIMQEAVRAARREGKTPEEVIEEVRIEALRRVSGEEGPIAAGLLVREKEEEAVRLVREEEPEEEVKPKVAPPEDEAAEVGEKLSQFELDELRRELESRGVPPHEIDTIMEQARILPRELVEELVKSLGDRKK